MNWLEQLLWMEWGDGADTTSAFVDWAKVMPYKKAALRHMEPHKHKGQAEQGRSGVPAGQHVQVFSIKIYLLFAELAKATLTL